MEMMSNFEFWCAAFIAAVGSQSESEATAKGHVAFCKKVADAALAEFKAARDEAGVSGGPNVVELCAIAAELRSLDRSWISETAILSLAARIEKAVDR